MKIQTSFWRKPIPTDKYDWEAVEDDYDLGSPIGRGATEREAIDDLLEQIKNREAETHEEELKLGEFTLKVVLRDVKGAKSQ